MHLDLKGKEEHIGSGSGYSLPSLKGESGKSKHLSGELSYRPRKQLSGEKEPRADGEMRSIRPEKSGKSHLGSASTISEEVAGSAKGSNSDKESITSETLKEFKKKGTGKHSKEAKQPKGSKKGGRTGGTTGGSKSSVSNKEHLSGDRELDQEMKSQEENPGETSSKSSVGKVKIYGFTRRCRISI